MQGWRQFLYSGDESPHDENPPGTRLTIMRRRVRMVLDLPSAQLSQTH